MRRAADPPRFPGRAKMRILLSNDDGYFAPGIERLAAALAPHAELTVVAPERDRSGASNSLTLDRPLTVRRRRTASCSSTARPTDCVHLAVTGLLDMLPDMVISGINLGRQHGRRHDLLGHGRRGDRGLSAGHSVDRDLARVEGRARTSTPPPRSRSSSSSVMRREPSNALAAQRQRARRAALASLSGYRVTRLGRRHKAEDVIRSQKPARRNRLLGRRRGRRGGRRRGHRFSCGRAALRVGHAAADRSHEPRPDDAGDRLDRAPTIARRRSRSARRRTASYAGTGRGDGHAGRQSHRYRHDVDAHARRG